MHRRHLVHCCNTAKSTLSWVGQLLGPGVHPHDVGTDLSCEQSMNEGQLVRILHVQVFAGIRWSLQRASSVSQPAVASFLGLAIIFSRNMPGDLVASHRYHFADPLSSSSTSAWPLVCCWSVAYLPPVSHALLSQALPNRLQKKRCVSGGEKEDQRNSVMHSDVSQVAWRMMLCNEMLHLPGMLARAAAMRAGNRSSAGTFLTRFSFSSATKFHQPWQHLKIRLIVWLQLTSFKTERRGVHAENQSTRKPITFLEWSTSLRFLLVAWAGIQGRLRIRYV